MFVAVREDQDQVNLIFHQEGEGGEHILEGAGVFKRMEGQGGEVAVVGQMVAGTEHRKLQTISSFSSI